MPSEYRKQALTFESEIFKTSITIATAVVAGVVALMTVDNRTLLHECFAGAGGIVFCASMRIAAISLDKARDLLEEIKEEENGTI